MTLFDALRMCGNRYDQYIQMSWVGGSRDKMQSGVMKKGNITYKKLDHYGYGYEVKYIFPKIEKDKKILFLQLFSLKENK